MKIVKILVIGLLTAVAAYASTGEEAYIKLASKSETVPTVVKVVSPIVDSEFANTKLTFEFVVNSSGLVESLKTDSKADPKLVAVLSEAIAQWRFTPAIRDGKAVSVKVVLPVYVTDKA
jgi:hypothetical protein